MVEALTRIGLWLLANVVFSLAPVIISYVILRVFKPHTKWYRVIKDGELFIFSTTLSSTSVSTAYTMSTGGHPISLLNVGALTMFFALSAAMFGITSYLKFHGKTFPDVKNYNLTAILCAIFVIILSYSITIR